MTFRYAVEGRVLRRSPAVYTHAVGVRDDQGVFILISCHKSLEQTIEASRSEYAAIRTSTCPRIVELEVV